MDRSRLKPPTVATTTSTREKNDSAGKLYGSVKLKKTGMIETAATKRLDPGVRTTAFNIDALKKVEGKKVYEAVELKNTGAATKAVPNRNDEIGKVDKKAYEVVKLKKTGVDKEAPVRKKVVVERNSSFDSFDS
jgi:hypothetical protein